jgi:hypothetical protein
MKQLIVLTAVLPLMLIFMAQFTLEQKNNHAINTIQQQVYIAKEQAKQEGYFTPDIIEELKDNISARLGISKNDISVAATETPRYRINFFDSSLERGLIHYSVSVPIEKIMAGGNILGISEEENRMVYTVEGSAASELLPN